MVMRVEKSDDEWRRQLTNEQFDICRRAGTERPFSGKYNDFKGAGLFRCGCCGNPLFDSSTKFDSGTGWPSFFAPVSKQAVALHQDRSLSMTRVEALCAACDAHLGHVFDDGPPPTGQRYCMNSLSLDFEAAEDGD